MIVMKYNKENKMKSMRDTTFLTNRIQHNFGEQN